MLTTREQFRCLLNAIGGETNAAVLIDPHDMLRAHVRTPAGRTLNLALLVNGRTVEVTDDALQRIAFVNIPCDLIRDTTVRFICE